MDSRPRRTRPQAPGDADSEVNGVYDYDGRRRGDEAERNVSAPQESDAKAPMGRRRSILVDPDDRAGARERRRARSNSQVRIKEPASDQESVDSNDGWWVRRRDGRMEFVYDKPGQKPRKKPPPDLERKTSPRNQEFREKRDGYESEEGDTLRDAKGRGAGRRYQDRDRDGDDMPPPRSRGIDVKDGLYTAGGAVAGAGLGAAAAAAARPNNRRAETAPDRGPAPRGDPRDRYRGDRDRDRDRDRARGGRDDDYDDRRRRPPPRNSYDDARRPPRRDYDDDSYYDDRRRTRPSRNDTYDSDRAPPRSTRRTPRRRYDDESDDDMRPVRSKSLDDRDRRRGRRRDSRERDKGRGADWKKEAGALLLSTAMPLIKKEGGRMLRKQLEGFGK